MKKSEFTTRLNKKNVRVLHEVSSDDAKYVNVYALCDIYTYMKRDNAHAIIYVHESAFDERVFNSERKNTAREYVESIETCKRNKNYSASDKFEYRVEVAIDELDTFLTALETRIAYTLDVSDITTDSTTATANATDSAKSDSKRNSKRNSKKSTTATAKSSKNDSTTDSTSAK